MDIAVLSLFDGLAGARLALEKLGWNVKKYYASGIQKSSIAVSSDNFPDIIHLGDVNKVNGSDYADIDLLIGGSPCQSLSSLVSMNGMSSNLTGKSKLFYQYFRILNEIKKINHNVKFVLENVASMSDENRDMISAMLDVEPIFIDSCLLTGQLRARYYWTNIRGVQQPEDAGISFSSVLDGGWYTERSKSLCITATYHKGVPTDYLIKKVRQIKFNQPVEKYNDTFIINGEDIEIIPGLGAEYNKESIHKLSKYSSKLSITELGKLQGIRPGYTKAGGSFRYQSEMIGNGFTIDVIAHILSYMNRTDVHDYRMF